MDTPTVESPSPAPKPETPAPAEPAKTSDTGGPKRLQIGANVVLQIIIVAVIVGLLNFISFRHYKRWDFSRDQTYELSDQTKNLLGNLQKPVTAIVFFSQAGGPTHRDVTNLLKQYEYASARKLTYEEVDPNRNLTRARELADKYKFGELENIVILDYEGRSKFVNAAEMVQMLPNGGPMEDPKMLFKGEAAITSALLELVEGKPQKLYFVAGHGEPPVPKEVTGMGDELGIVSESFARANIKHDTLNLLAAGSVPADATVVAIIGPKQDFTEREIELLNDYWTKNGRLLIALDALAKTPHLHAWLAQQGVTPAGDVVLRTLASPAGMRVLISVDGKFNPEGQPVTRDLAGRNAFFFGPTTSFQTDPSTSMGPRSIKLAESGKDYWGELSFDGSNRAVFFEPNKEKNGPLTVAVALEKGAMPGVKVDTARLVAIGNASFITDNGLREFPNGLAFGVNAVNWLLNREQGVGVGVPPKDKRFITLKLDEKQMRTLAIGVMGVIPALVAFCGVLCWFTRRN